MFARTHAPCVGVSVCLSVSLPVLLARALFSPFLSPHLSTRVYLQFLHMHFYRILFDISHLCA